MPGLGLQGAFGVDAMSEAIRQRIKDQLAEQAQTQTLNLNAREQLLREAQAEQARKIQDETLRQLQEERQARAEQAKQATLRSRLSLLTPGMTLTPETAAGIPGELREPTPLTASVPEALAAPDDTGTPETIPGTIANAPAPALQTETYRGTPEQQDIQQQKILRGRLLSDPNLGPRERLAIQLESAGLKVPAGVFEPKPANPLPIHDTGQGLMRPNAQGVMEPVLDAQGRPVQGYHQPRDTSASDANRLDRSYQYHRSALDKLAVPLEQQNERMGRLIDTVNQNSPQADALIAPELLTVMAGGTGSGLRMNEAEISRIIGGRSNFESLKAALNKWQTDPTKALSITAAQREQIKALIGEVAKRSQDKLDAINKAGDELINANDEPTHRRILAQARKQLQTISTAPSTTQQTMKPTAAELIKKYGG